MPRSILQPHAHAVRDTLYPRLHHYHSWSCAGWCAGSTDTHSDINQRRRGLSTIRKRGRRAREGPRGVRRSPLARRRFPVSGSLARPLTPPGCVAYVPLMRLRAVLFDFGGTLDGPASHWLDRFLALYRDAGVDLSFERFRPAFDAATRAAYANPAVAGMDLRATVTFHTRHQVAHLGPAAAAVADRIADAFLDRAAAALAASRSVLELLRPHVALGVVSNFYGNVDRVLADNGIAPLLDAIVDSNRVGLRKPAPGIFTLALRRVGCLPLEALYVGDSFNNDIAGAWGAGLRTAWLVGSPPPVCPDPLIVDHRIHALAELPAIVAGARG